jgi:hypothetical protein
VQRRAHTVRVCLQFAVLLAAGAIDCFNHLWRRRRTQHLRPARQVALRFCRQAVAIGGSGRSRRKLRPGRCRGYSGCGVLPHSWGVKHLCQCCRWVLAVCRDGCRVGSLGAGRWDQAVSGWLVWLGCSCVAACSCTSMVLLCMVAL